MILYPKLKVQAPYRQKIEAFKGYHRDLRIGSGEFYEMKNLTSDDYPVLSPRKKRGKVTGIQDGGYATGMLYVPGIGMFIVVNHQEDHSVDEYGALYLLDTTGQLQTISRSLTAGPKSLAVMGTYLIIAPDMVWVSLDNCSWGSMGYTHEITGGILNAEPCDARGNAYEPYVLSPTEPQEPTNGMVWQDNSVFPNTLKRYSSVQGQWAGISTTYVKLYSSSGELDHHQFCEHDGVTISGLGRNKEGKIDKYDLNALNGSHVIECAGDGYIVIPGMVDGCRGQSVLHTIRFEKAVPKMDFILECGNRLWGCARDTNEIYACKLGDWSNWNVFQGLSTDSWVGSVGTPGEFTGAVVHNGYPIFYKENCKHKVWPSATGAHQMTTVQCNGVEKGSESSLAVCDGTVFYKSTFGVFADDGGGAVEIGQALGNTRYRNAMGAIHDRKYYLSMENSTGKRELLVYDIARRIWHCEDSIYGVLCSAWDGLFSAHEDILDLTGKTGTPEKEVSWMAVTGDLGLELPEQKYISRLTLRLSLDPGATLEVYAQYDREETWVKLGQVYGTDLRSFSLPVRPRRCDQLRLKLQGTGMCKLYSITKTLEKGSELS